MQPAVGAAQGRGEYAQTQLFGVDGGQNAQVLRAVHRGLASSRRAPGGSGSAPPSAVLRDEDVVHPLELPCSSIICTLTSRLELTQVSIVFKVVKTTFSSGDGGGSSEEALSGVSRGPGAPVRPWPDCRNAAQESRGGQARAQFGFTTVTLPFSITPFGYLQRHA